MLKKTITYKDYNGVERTETHRFNLSESELVKMEMSINGGFVEMAKRVIDAQDAPSLIKIFEDLISKSYGVMSADGKHFDKSEEITKEFMNTEAYNQLFMELVTDANAASEFFNGIVPSDLADKYGKGNTTN